MRQTLQGKRIAVVIAFRNFRDEEYFTPREVLQSAGAEIVTVSDSVGTAVGADGGETQAEKRIEDIQATDFDAVVFIGGPGMAKKLDDKTFHQLARDTINNSRVLGAICIAPALLAKAGILEGRKATVWSSPMDKTAIKMLQAGGAQYEDKAVVADGRIVTANGPEAAKTFAEKLIEVLENGYPVE